MTNIERGRTHLCNCVEEKVLKIGLARYTQLQHAFKHLGTIVLVNILDQLVRERRLTFINIGGIKLYFDADWPFRIEMGEKLDNP